MNEITWRNHFKFADNYVAPGSFANCGFKSDKDEGSTSGEKSATLPMVQSPKTEHEGKFHI